MADATEELAVLEEAGAQLEVIEGGGGDSQNVEDLDSYISKEYGSNKNTDGFRHDILSMVSHKKYRGVLKEIDAFYKEKERTMPHFNVKAKRYFDYIKQLIEAIEEHKTIPNFDQLPAAQQKKVHEQVFTYFDELNNTLKRVEKVIHDLKVQDVRSTIWFLKTFSYCVMVILSVMAFTEAVEWIGNPLPVLFRSFEEVLMN